MRSSFSLSIPTKLGSAIGKAMAVIDVASASGRIGDRQLAVGSQVFIGDRITTDATGEAQLLFDDGTRMVVGIELDDGRSITALEAQWQYLEWAKKYIDAGTDNPT